MGICSTCRPRRPAATRHPLERPLARAAAHALPAAALRVLAAPAPLPALAPAPGPAPALDPARAVHLIPRALAASRTTRGAGTRVTSRGTEPARRNQRCPPSRPVHKLDCGHPRRLSQRLRRTLGRRQKPVMLSSSSIHRHTCMLTLRQMCPLTVESSRVESLLSGSVAMVTPRSEFVVRRLRTSSLCGSVVVTSDRRLSTSCRVSTSPVTRDERVAVTTVLRGLAPHLCRQSATVDR